MSLFPIDKVLELVLSLRPVGGEEVSDARSTGSNRGPKYHLHLLIQLEPCGVADVTRIPIRMQPSAKENLVCVDVPNPGNDLLMH